MKQLLLLFAAVACGAQNGGELLYNGIRLPVAWKNGKDLATIAGRPVRIRFRLHNARLYSFWASASESGASRGFVGGGPGFEHSYDDAGMAACRAAEVLRP